MRRGTMAMAMVAVVAALAGCGQRETPEQRLERLRLAHEITPLGYTTVHGEDGEPVTVVDLHVVNRGTEPLPHLTVMIRVVGPDGTVVTERRTTLDLSEARPGVGIQTAGRVPGLEVGPEDQVQVELESGLPPDVLHSLPEWRDVRGAPVS